MSHFRLTIPGTFDDAIYYMGQLIAITPERKLQVVDVERALSEHFYEDAIPAIYRFYILRNDWLRSSRLDLMLTVPEVRRSISDLAESSGLLIMTPRWQAIRANEHMFGKGDILDLHAYNRRLYVSTTEGLFDIDFSVEQGEVDFATARKRIDARCLSASIKYGSLVASCGSDGLFAAYDDFGTLRQLKGHRRELQHAGRASARASWLGYSVTNYTDATSFQFLSGTKQAATDDLQQPYSASGARYRDEKSQVVTRLTEDPRSSITLAQETTGADFVSNSAMYFFVHMPTSEYRLYTHQHRKGKIVGSARNVSAGKVDEALSAHTFHEGIVVETFDKVHLITSNGIEQLYDGPALKVRTFPAGRHCFNIIAIIDEDALHLVSPVPQ